MKLIYALAAAALYAFPALAAGTAAIDVTKLTCEDFLNTTTTTVVSS